MNLIQYYFVNLLCALSSNIILDLYFQLIYITSNQDVFIIGEPDDGEIAVDYIHSCVPDIVIIDLRIPKKSGIDAIKQVRDHYPEMKILILTNLYDSKQRNLAYAVGADYVFDKLTEFEDMIDIVRLLAETVEIVLE